MRKRTMLVFAFMGVLGTAAVGHAQTDYKALLVGTWQGDVQERSAKNTDRTLVIRSVAKGDPPTIKAQYGVTGRPLGRVEGTLDTSGDKPVLRLTTSAGSKIVLRVHDDNNLIGTVEYPGKDQRVPAPLRLKKKTE